MSGKHSSIVASSFISRAVSAMGISRPSPASDVLFWRARHTVQPLGRFLFVLEPSQHCALSHYAAVQASGEAYVAQTFIMEQYLDGPEVDVDIIVSQVGLWA